MSKTKKTYLKSRKFSVDALRATTTPATGSVKPFQPLGEHYGSEHPWINGNGPIYYHPNRFFVNFIC